MHGGPDPWKTHRSSGVRPRRVVDALSQASQPLGTRPSRGQRLLCFDDETALAGVIGTGHAGHALALTLVPHATKAGVLPSDRVVRRGRPQYYDPLGLPLRTTRFRHWLIRAALP
jgi:hypothetical protein